MGLGKFQGWRRILTKRKPLYSCSLTGNYKSFIPIACLFRKTFHARSGAMVEFENSWKDFSYTFVGPGSRRERFDFSTFKSSGSDEELEEIMTVYGNSEVMRQISGVDSATVSLEQARNVREAHRERTSLVGDKKSIRWKLHYTDVMEQKTSIFAGFMGLSFRDSSRLLEPHVRLRPEFHSRGLGTKGLLCLLAKLLTQKAWLRENVDGLFIEIHPRNEACFSLKSKLLENVDTEQMNPDREDGVWVMNYRWWSDNKTRESQMRQFSLNGMEALEKMFNSKVRHRENAMELTLLNNDERSTVH